MEVSMSSDTTPRRHSFPGQRVLDPGHFVFWYPGGMKLLDIPNASQKPC
jgi:hypothetical protein